VITGTSSRGRRRSPSGRGSRRARRPSVDRATTGAETLSRRKVPRRYRECFSPEHPLPRSVEYIPYRHAITHAKHRLRRTPAAYLALAIVWLSVSMVELVGGSSPQPVLLGLCVLSLVIFASWNAFALIRMRRGHPSGAVWRYGVFLWPEMLVILPASGPVVVVPIDAIDDVQMGRDSDRTASGTTTSRVVRIVATDNRGEMVSVTIDDLGAMPAPHLVRAIETWRTGGVDPDLLAAAPTAGTAINRRLLR